MSAKSLKKECLGFSGLLAPTLITEPLSRIRVCDPVQVLERRPPDVELAPERSNRQPHEVVASAGT